jgi:hypothetical protein
MEGKITEAFSIFDHHVERNDPQRLEKLEMLKLDASWELIRTL